MFSPDLTDMDYIGGTIPCDKPSLAGARPVTFQQRRKKEDVFQNRGVIV